MNVRFWPKADIQNFNIIDLAIARMRERSAEYLRRKSQGAVITREQKIIRFDGATARLLS
jgi:hypothetical protein